MLFRDEVVLQCQFFTLVVDLCDAEGILEQNLVMCPNTAFSALPGSNPHPPVYNLGSGNGDDGAHPPAYLGFPPESVVHEYKQYRRNLFGNLVTSAFRLKDDKSVPGIWFILQDLSVRTEGVFKLKFSFFNLGLYRLC